MKNIIKNKYIGLMLIAGLVSMTSCEDDNFNHSPSGDKPIVSNVGATTLTITEGSTATIDLSISSPISREGYLRFRPVSGNADFSDYVIGDGEKIDYANGEDPYHTGGPEGYIVKVPAYSGSISIPVEAVFDVTPEGNESVTVVLETYNNRELLVNGGGITYTINITNYVSNELDITFAWGDEYCAVDFDLELYDGSGSTEIVHSWGGCPEFIYIGTSDITTADDHENGALADGTYVIFASMYSLSGQSFNPPVNFPVTLTVTKVGQIQEVIDLGTHWNSVDGGYAQGNPDYAKIYLLTKSGTTYTLVDYETMETVFQG